MGGLGLIIMSNVNLSYVKLMLGWVSTIYVPLDRSIHCCSKLIRCGDKGKAKINVDLLQKIKYKNY